MNTAFIKKHYGSLLITAIIILPLLGAALFQIASFEHKSTIFLIFTALVIGVAFAIYIDQVWRGRFSRGTATNPAPRQPEIAPPAKHWSHAKKAVKDAGWNATEKVLDIGLVAFWGSDTAYTHRTQAIPSSAEAIQPYIEMRSDTPIASQVEFIIEDHSGKPVFRHNAALTEGQQFITPPARLRISELQPRGKWTLRISVNGALWAVHRFTWRTDDIKNLDGQINSDGEVDDHVLPLLADDYAQPMSLDDLLDGKDDAAKQA